MSKRLKQAVFLLFAIPSAIVLFYIFLNETIGCAHEPIMLPVPGESGSLGFRICTYMNVLVLVFIFTTILFMVFHLVAFKSGKILPAYLMLFITALFYFFIRDEFSLMNLNIRPNHTLMLVLRSIAVPFYTASIVNLCYRLFPERFPAKTVIVVEFMQIIPIISDLSLDYIPVLSFIAEFILILPLIPCLYVFAIAYASCSKYSLRFGICLFLAEADLLLRNAPDGLAIPIRYACLPAVGSFMVLNVIMMADKYRSQNSMESYYKESLDHYLNALQSSENAFLNAQIKPHFLYNTLNTIADLCVTDPKKAKSLIDSLTEYLKLILELDNMEEQVPLKRELELAKAYTAIEKERFPSVNFYNDFPFKMPNISLPALTIQPLIENALKHGVRKSNRPGAITLRIMTSDESVNFYVSDNGVGMTEDTIERLFAEPKDNKSIGIYNIDKRLKNQYGAGLSVDSTVDLGTCVSFSIPK
ncbi:MAG: histidine kinase [Lachnospiraceae bacterium]|nr:histidine kinase [Lachnospiraceae bacterium]